MEIATLTLDTQIACDEDIACLTKDGQVIHAEGIVNTRWNECSALDAALEASLAGVVWNYAADDTPGMLVLTIMYPHLTQEAMIERFRKVRSVEDYEMASASP